MTVTVKIPTQLRALTDGAAQVKADGDTVGQLVKDLDARFPGLGERLLDEGGSLRRFVNVYVEDEDVRFLEGLNTSVAPDATVSIIPAVAGG